jgi:amino acid transporter
MVNLRGITFTARMNLLGLYIQLAVLAIFAVAVGVAWWHGRVHWGIDPFYRKGVFSISRIFSAIPIAALSYIGFDAISTLNEEAKGGGRTVSKATMIVLVAVAALFVAQARRSGPAPRKPLSTTYRSWPWVPGSRSSSR